jgi:hypothetical protein
VVQKLKSFESLTTNYNPDSYREQTTNPILFYLNGKLQFHIFYIFKPMKKAAGILLLIWTFVLVQPAFAYFGGKSAYGNCSKVVSSKTSCSKTKKSPSTGCTKKKVTSSCSSKKKCNKSSDSKEEKGCNSNTCNPSIGCTSGNLYIHQHSQILFALSIAQRQKAILVDDNRILESLSECWHPPEAYLIQQ